ncbi:hypothetical protein K0M31_016037 [Melipona bicolor]|uniref:Uncharacterized protein n=1 Tax=Melipona bicolor TaxID=60889 RepID=A0AA40G6L7_9HYME|nr:hypothetical protein K0M31_016037 [Melipona bicolor]
MWRNGWPKRVDELDGYRLPLSGSASPYNLLSSTTPLLPTDTLEDKGGLGDFMNILFVRVAFDALVHLEHVGSSARRPSRWCSGKHQQQTQTRYAFPLS